MVLPSATKVENTTLDTTKVDDSKDRELRVGDVVYRKGEHAKIVHIDRTMMPFTYTVKMTRSGNEVNTEADFLFRNPPEVAVVPYSAAAAHAAAATSSASEATAADATDAKVSAPA